MNRFNIFPIFNHFDYVIWNDGALERSGRHGREMDGSRAVITSAQRSPKIKRIKRSTRIFGRVYVGECLRLPLKPTAACAISDAVEVTRV